MEAFESAYQAYEAHRLFARDYDGYVAARAAKGNGVGTEVGFAVEKGVYFGAFMTEFFWVMDECSLTYYL